MAIHQESLMTAPSADELSRRRPFRYGTSDPAGSRQPFPLPPELVHEILSYLGRDSLWDFAAVSTRSYTAAFPLLYSRLALGSQKQRVHLGEYDGVRETTGRHRTERKKLANFLGWEDHEELRMDLFMLELGKEALTKSLKIVHFKSPDSEGAPLAYRTFELLGSMTSLRYLSLYQPIRVYDHKLVAVENPDGRLECRLVTGIHTILESIAHLKTLQHLEVDVDLSHWKGKDDPEYPDIPLAATTGFFPSLTSLSIKYDSYDSAITDMSWNVGSGVAALLMPFFIKGLLSSSRDSLQDLRIAANAPFRLEHVPYASSPVPRAEADLNFNLGSLVGPQLRVFDYQGMNRQPDVGRELSVETFPSHTDFARVCAWFPRLRELRIREEFRALDASGYRDSFIASPFGPYNFRENLEAAWCLRDLELLDVSQRRYEDGDLETQQDFLHFGSLLPHRSPLSNPFRQADGDGDGEPPLDQKEAEDEERLLRQTLLAQETSRALSSRMPRLREVRWCANNAFVSTRDPFCWFAVSGGKVVSAGSPGMRRRDRLKHEFARRESEPYNAHLYLVNVFGMRKKSI